MFSKRNLNLILWALLSPFFCSHAQAADTVITFDNLPPSTWLTTQYQAQGVQFGMPPYSSLPTNSQIPSVLCCIPVTLAAPPGHSNQVAYVSGSAQEEWQAGMFGTFSVFHQTMRVDVGDSLAGETASVLLTIYDVNGQLITKSAVLTVTGGSQATTLSVAGGGSVPKIAFFLIQAVDMNKHIWVDNLTFDNPATQGDPDFTLGPASGGNYFTVAQGDTATQTIPINRYNGSRGPIYFNAAGLLPGVTASFWPNPVWGTGSSTTLSLTAAPDAPLNSQDSLFTLSADPRGRKAVGPHVRVAQLPNNVGPAFIIAAPWGFPSKISFCTPLTVGIFVEKISSAIGDVALSLRVVTVGGTADLPPFIHAQFSPPISPQGSGSTSHTLTISADSGSLGDIPLVVQGTSGSMAVLSQMFILIGDPARIDSVTPSAGRTPQYLQPGTGVTITGANFCPPLFVRFGNNFAIGVPVSETSTMVRVPVPRFATTGPISLVPSPNSAVSWQPVVSPSVFTVDSFRNTAGFSFHNYLPHITFDELTAAFGEYQTYFPVELCWPFDCTISVRDPIAMIVNSIINNALDPCGGACPPGTHKGGACWGIALGSQRFLAGQRSRSGFPATWTPGFPLPPPAPQTNFALDSPSLDDNGTGPSGPLESYLNSQSATQFSTEMFDQFTSQKDQPAEAVFNAIHNALNAGEAPLIGLAEFNGFPPEGHTVVGYDLAGSPSEFTVWVYDPVMPFTAVEDSDPTSFTHTERVTQSTIHMTSDGNWTLQSNLDSSGNFYHGNKGVIVTRASTLPLQPTMVGGTLAELLNSATVVVFGGGGQSDSAGQLTGPGVLASRTTQLVDANGQPLNAVPYAALTGEKPTVEFLLLPPKTQTIRQTVLGIQAAPDHHMVVAPNFAARLDTQAVPGISDQIAFGASGVEFQTESSNKPLTVGIVNQAKGIFHTAELVTTSFRAAKDEFRFDPVTSSVIFRHAGQSTPFQVRFSALGSNVPLATFDSGGLHVGSGDTVTITPGNWSHMSSVTITVRDWEGHEHSEQLPNRAEEPQLGRVSDLDIERVADKSLARHMEVHVHLEQLPLDSQVAVAWTVRDWTGNIVAHKAQVLNSDERNARDKEYEFNFVAPAKGHYTAKVDLAVTTHTGVIPEGQIKSSSRTFEID
jgi:hypothetical protein